MSTAVLCECGTALSGRSKRWCSECVVRNHPGSSQCPFCLDWYYTHSGNTRESVMKLHASKACRKT
jgi:hypothetical protein